MVRPIKILLAALPILLLFTAAWPQERDDFASDATTQYLTAKTDDPVSRLQKRLDTGATKLTWGPRGYLDAVLKELSISPKTQTLVFSKTSLQRDRISPHTPRALYFSDDSYVGWCLDGSVVELAVQDAIQGTIFYTLDQSPSRTPRFVRQSFECLQCHSSPMTDDVPGLAMRSVYTLADGTPDLREGSRVTTDQSTFSERFGGWYVSGRHGKMRHQGNALARVQENSVLLDREAGANALDLRPYFDTRPYKTPHSDLAALLVLAHQTQVHNKLTKASYLVRDALRDERQMNAALHETGRRPSTTRRIAAACEPLVEVLLFSGEAPLTAPIIGTSGFETWFSALGPRDREGRSLRQLDLTKRLLRYPCSFLIYSAPFDALPREANAYLAQRFTEILRGKDGSGRFAHLSVADRRAITEILQATKPGFLGTTQEDATRPRQEHSLQPPPTSAERP